MRISDWSSDVCSSDLLNFATLLKSFQRLGYFPDTKDIPPVIVGHHRKFLCLPEDVKCGYGHNSGLYRHHERIRTYLGIKPWKNIQNQGLKAHNPGQRIAIQAAFQAARTMNNPAYIINFVIEELIHQRF